MRHLFPPFLQGRLSAGVLLLRLALACSLAQSLITGLPIHGFSQIFVFPLEMLIAVLLVVGLWTPVVGGVVCVLQLSMAFAANEAPQPHLLQAVMGLSITLLGPGSLSADARLFGRRRVEIQEIDNG